MEIGATIEQSTPGDLPDPLCVGDYALLVHGQDLAAAHDPAAVHHDCLDVATLPPVE